MEDATYRPYRFEGDLLITKETFTVHDHDYIVNEIPKPCLRYKTYTPIQEGMDIQITSRGIVNGQVIKICEYYNTNSEGQYFTMSTTEFGSNETDGKIKTVTLHDRYNRILHV